MNNIKLIEQAEKVLQIPITNVILKEEMAEVIFKQSVIVEVKFNPIPEIKLLFTSADLNRTRWGIVFNTIKNDLLELVQEKNQGFELVLIPLAGRKFKAQQLGTINELGFYEYYFDFDNEKWCINQVQNIL